MVSQWCYLAGDKHLKNPTTNILLTSSNTCLSHFLRCNRFDASVSAVKAADEYTKFIDQNRTSPPSPVVFRFDETLLDGFHGGQITLNPLTVALDDLTIDTLKQRLQVLEWLRSDLLTVHGLICLYT